ncbi:MAG: deoxynucleoside kinase [Deltaproteobacteria bacterium]|nr:deoxynucleoside kinase [Deltaproteobacteria bacterium]
MENLRYITIEGPIGVGKTSLVELLACEFNGKTLIEDAEGNPFLPRFYGDTRKHALQTQLFFLLNRYQQQKELAQQDLFDGVIISDYLFAKDRIFAYLNLDENELALYEQVYRLLDAKIRKPDLVIYLQASTDVLLDRIRQRAKTFERDIKEEYLLRLIDSYNRYFFYYNDTPLLVVNTTEIDFVNNEADLKGLAKKIKSMKGGKEYFMPMASREPLFEAVDYPKPTEIKHEEDNGTGHR